MFYFYYISRDSVEIKISKMRAIFEFFFLNIWSFFSNSSKSVPWKYFFRCNSNRRNTEMEKKIVSTACNELNISVLVLWRRSTDFITPSFYVATIYFIFIHAEDIGLFRYYFFVFCIWLLIELYKDIIKMYLAPKKDGLK